MTGRRTAAGLGKNGPPGPALRDLLSGSSGAVPSPIRSRHDLVQAGVRELSPISRSPLVQAGVRELSPISPDLPDLPPISPISDLPPISPISGSPSPAAEFAFLAVRLYSGLHRLPVTPEQVARERLGAAIHRRVGDDLRLGRLVETLEAPSDYPPDPGITSVTAPSRVNIVLRFTQTTTTATRTKNQVS